MSQLFVVDLLSIILSVVLLETLGNEWLNFNSIYVGKHSKGSVRYSLIPKGYIDTIEKGLHDVDSRSYFK